MPVLSIPIFYLTPSFNFYLSFFCISACVLIPSKTNAVSSPLPETCKIDVAQGSEYQYPVLLLCGELHLFTNNCHSSEERNRFRSESIISGSIISKSTSKSDEDDDDDDDSHGKNDDVLFLPASSLAEHDQEHELSTGVIDVEVMEVTQASATPGPTPDSQLPTSFPQGPRIRLISPFVGLEEDTMPEMSREGSHANSDGGGLGRVWQCALLGLPCEMTIEVCE